MQFRRLEQAAPPRGRVAGPPRAPCPAPVVVHMGSGDVCSIVEFGVRLVRFGWWYIMYFWYVSSTEEKAEQMFWSACVFIPMEGVICS